MTTALIGSTGFVGGNLLAQGRYDELYASKSVGDMRGRSFERVVCAGAPAAKWLANKEPEKDAASLARLTDVLSTVRAREFVLISTVDVYPLAIEVDEDDAPTSEECQPYGRHRLELERFVRERFEDALIVRLPGLFGPGLKKNVVFDFLHANRLDLVHQDGVFQLYDLAHVARDIDRARAAKIALLNVATEPVSTQAIARVVLQAAFENHLPPPAPSYDVRSLHASAWNRGDGYLYGRDEVLADLARFVAIERSRVR